jgi:hypothetical protein
MILLNNCIKDLSSQFQLVQFYERNIFSKCPKIHCHRGGICIPPARDSLRPLFFEEALLTSYATQTIILGYTKGREDD